MLAPFWRKLAMVVHVTSALGFQGAVAGFLAMSIVGLTAGTSALAAAMYPAMQVLAWYVILPLAIATLIVGIVQSLSTPWGLFRHYWVIVKLSLTLVALVVLTLQLPTIDWLAGAALDGTLTADGGQRTSLVLHAFGGFLVLIVATVLSVYKPQGTTDRGAERIPKIR